MVNLKKHTKTESTPKTQI